MTGLSAPVADFSGRCHASTSPSGFGVTVTFAGGTGTSTGTIETRLDRSLFAVCVSVTTAYVARMGRPSGEWNDGVSSYARRAPKVAAGYLAPSMLSTL